LAPTSAPLASTYTTLISASTDSSISAERMTGCSLDRTKDVTDDIEPSSKRKAAVVSDSDAHLTDADRPKKRPHLTPGPLYLPQNEDELQNEGEHEIGDIESLTIKSARLDVSLNPVLEPSSATTHATTYRRPTFLLIGRRWLH